FDASSENMFYVNVNYDCSNVKIPPTPRNSNVAIQTYRRVYSPTIDPAAYNANSRIPSPFRSQGLPYAETYYIYKGEDILQLEVNPSSFGEPNRQAPQPFLIPDEPPFDTLKNDPVFKDVIGRVLCDSEYANNGAIEYDNLENWVINGNITAISNLPANRVEQFVPATFIPPALQQIENIVLDVLYLFWAFLGMASLVMLIVIGFKLMTSGFSPEQRGDTLKQFAMWFVGLILGILAIPLLQFIYRAIGISTTECYRYTVENSAGEPEIVYDLTMPGFTFFFGDVCTGEFAIENAP
ncbi:hypothetical protein KC717_07110, partial [Candidatus Dojkabacteria bacterium]|nr:hypothetical protein [Candidatus Dojkabacteria bacterium]